MRTLRPRGIAYSLGDVGVMEDIAPHVLTPVGGDRRHHDNDCINEGVHDGLVHRNTHAHGPVTVKIPGNHQLKPAQSQTLTEHDGLKLALGGITQVIDFVQKAAVHEQHLAVRGTQLACLSVLQRRLDPLLAVVQIQNSLVGEFRLEVCIFDRVSRVAQGKTSGICRVLLTALQEHEEVTLALRHLLLVHHDMSIAVHAARPHLRAVLPDLQMVVETHGQMVGDQVSGRHSKVHGVPVLELGAHGQQLALADGAISGVCLVQEYEVEHAIAQLTGQNLVLGASALATEVAAFALQQVCNSIVSHVDGGVGQRLNHELLVPRQLSAQTHLTAARPLLQPSHHLLELLHNSDIVCLEVIAVEVVRHGISPSVLSVLQEPLVHQGDHTLVPSARHDQLLRLKIQERISLCNHVSLLQWLRIAHLGASVRPHDHHALVEPLLVGLVLHDLELVRLLR
mmetsp:Transcript_18649/g.34838  ORF Transcript_18649/g.34838 Transcript_18649/m.34838 type:complete len:453 (+) Transcript_18649:721-2079(+)